MLEFEVEKGAGKHLSTVSPLIDVVNENEKNENEKKNDKWSGIHESLKARRHDDTICPMIRETSSLVIGRWSTWIPTWGPHFLHCQDRVTWTLTIFKIAGSDLVQTWTWSQTFCLPRACFKTKLYVAGTSSTLRTLFTTRVQWFLENQHKSSFSFQSSWIPIRKTSVDLLLRRKNSSFPSIRHLWNLFGKVQLVRFSEFRSLKCQNISMGLLFHQPTFLQDFFGRELFFGHVFSLTKLFQALQKRCIMFNSPDAQLSDLEGAEVSEHSTKPNVFLRLWTWLKSKDLAVKKQKETRIKKGSRIGWHWMWMGILLVLCNVGVREFKASYWNPSRKK